LQKQGELLVNAKRTHFHCAIKEDVLLFPFHVEEALCQPATLLQSNLRCRIISSITAQICLWGSTQHCIQCKIIGHYIFILHYQAITMHDNVQASQFVWEHIGLQSNVSKLELSNRKLHIESTRAVESTARLPRVNIAYVIIIRTWMYVLLIRTWMLDILVLSRYDLYI
jgi:hypothetical protein